MASKNLDKVRELQSPDYGNDSVALVHLLRYQFSHVNLAWSMLAESKICERLSAQVSPQPLQIVDVGAGNLATLFGVTLLVAEHIGTGASPISVDLTSCEPSSAMRTLGGSAWETFRCLANNKSRSDFSVLRPVRVALSHVHHRHDPAELGQVRILQGAHRCLTSMHSTYDDPQQQAALRRELEIICDELAPTSGFLTCYHQHRESAIRLSPFRRRGTYLKPQPKMRDEPRRTRIAGNMAGVKREGRHNTPPHQAYAGWSNPLQDTSVLYWP